MVYELYENNWKSLSVTKQFQNTNNCRSELATDERVSVFPPRISNINPRKSHPAAILTETPYKARNPIEFNEIFTGLVLTVM